MKINLFFTIILGLTLFFFNSKKIQAQVVSDSIYKNLGEASLTQICEYLKHNFGKKIAIDCYMTSHSDCGCVQKGDFDDDGIEDIALAVKESWVYDPYPDTLTERRGIAFLFGSGKIFLYGAGSSEKCHFIQNIGNEWDNIVNYNIEALTWKAVSSKPLSYSKKPKQDSKLIKFRETHVRVPYIESDGLVLGYPEVYIIIYFVDNKCYEYNLGF